MSSFTDSYAAAISLTILNCGYSTHTETKIDFSRFCNLKDIVVHSDSYEFGSFTIPPNLRRLDVSQYLNLIKLELPGRFLPNMKEQVLYGNKVGSVAHIGNIIFLKVLSLSRNRVYDIKSLGKCTKLQKLDLSAKKMKSIEGVKNSRDLQMLDLCDNKLII
ncbi:hypothetical protein DASC09_025720 [Saccharomycopsis crataegensis]|uniref:Uncharacterized protein n=1 Tax=Saccharomycopsis crataegensis TaxID=43959 RepID=A0AAV5QKC8_9ASCO|nr:hypothetical protein DASC09_025720 [Saccharomycopsis crataegensis]